MALILYVETNFLMSIAKGQDPEADRFLQNSLSSVRIVIPDICYIEALSTWEDQKKYSLEFQNQIKNQINELDRNITSSSAQSLWPILQESKIQHEKIINDIEIKLAQTVDMVLSKAELIQLNSDIIREVSESSLLNPEKFLVENDLMDNLIITSILSHAKLNPTDEKVLLSNNSKDFGKPKVQKALQNAGIRKYFNSTKKFLGWLNSKNPRFEGI